MYATRGARCYLNGLIDEDSYQVAKDELIVQKNVFKKEKERLSKNPLCHMERTSQSGDFGPGNGRKITDDQITRRTFTGGSQSWRRVLYGASGRT
jgi:hypothetical protein